MPLHRPSYSTNNHLSGREWFDLTPSEGIFNLSEKPFYRKITISALDLVVSLWFE